MDLQSDLVDHEWRLVTIAGEAVSAEADRVPYLVFGADGRVSGSSGVNRVFGGYELDGNELRLPALASTLMAGPPEAMALEHRFLVALGTGGPVRIVGDRLDVGEVGLVRSTGSATVD